MPKIKQISGEWKPLKLEGTVLGDGIEDLIGIEELTDYKLEKHKKKAKTIVANEKPTKKNTVGSKRSYTSMWVEEDQPIDLESLLKKSKVKDDKVSHKKNKNQKEMKMAKTKDHQDQETCLKDSDDNVTSDSNINIDAWTILGVPTIVIKALADQNFQTPTTIQALTIPPAILGRRDILGAAETGSGKTLAFGIPIINGILELKSKADGSADADAKNASTGNSIPEEESGAEDSDVEEQEESFDEQIDENGFGCVRVINNIKMDTENVKPKKPLYALILTPTRELAIQIKNHLTKAAKYTDIKIAVLVGGMAAVKQERILSKGPEIVIATPGRLWELIQQGNPHLSQVDSIKYLAIDETDRMLEKGHFQELHNLLERINVNESKLAKRQMFVFSATLTMVHDIPDYLQRKKRKHVKSKIFKLTPGQKLQKIIQLLKIKNPKIVDVTRETGTADNLTECRIACTIDHKDYYLYYFLKKHTGRTLIFCNSIGCVKRLATLFSILECNPLPLHASMQQRQRLRNLERFQADEDGLLVATDVAARGLDIPNVEHVIHYQVPRTSESYVHRSGRTARAQKEGITVLMMEPSEKQNYSKLCKTLGRTQDLPTFPVVDRLLIAVKERVEVAREIDKLELMCRRDNAQKGWLHKAAEEMDVILDEDQTQATMETKEMADLKRMLKAKKHRLSTLLAKPLFPKGFSGKYPDVNVEFHLSDNTQKAVEVMKTAINENPKYKMEKPTAVAKRKSPLSKKRSKRVKKV